ncbi:MAG: methyltransferase domain-containing protein [Candidatus Rokubacteria bacterium]|nr:methyltransferase domain-containing protein [Candidatus Rokubacteria bacterium]
MPSEVARLFDAMAPSYATLEPWYAHLYDVLHGLLRGALAPPAGGRRPRALDAGCGTGFQAAVLAALGWEVHGVDLAAALLRVARQRLDAPLALASVEALPYADGAFGAVACCGSTLSFVDDPARALGELGRVLAPGGRLLLECEHKWNLDLGWALAGALAGDALGYGVTAREVLGPLLRRGVWPAYPGYGRLRVFTLAELRGLLRAAGLTPVRVWGIHAITNVIPSTVLHRARLPRAVAALYRLLRAADRALTRVPAAARVANSVVVLAVRPS